MSPAILRWTLVLGWMAVIFLLSAQPGMPGLLPGPLQRLATTIAHVGEYAVLSSLLLHAAVPNAVRPRILVLFTLWAAATLYGMSDEFHQSFVPGRDANLVDVLADAAGGLLGCGLAGFGATTKPRGSPGA